MSCIIGKSKRSLLKQHLVPSYFRQFLFQSQPILLPFDSTSHLCSNPFCKALIPAFPKLLDCLVCPLKQTGRMSRASSYAAGSSFVVSREAPVKRIVGLAFQYWKLELQIGITTLGFKTTTSASFFAHRGSFVNSPEDHWNRNQYPWPHNSNLPNYSTYIPNHYPPPQNESNPGQGPCNCTSMPNPMWVANYTVQILASKPMIQGPCHKINSKNIIIRTRFLLISQQRTKLIIPKLPLRFISFQL